MNALRRYLNRRALRKWHRTAHPADYRTRRPTQAPCYDELANQDYWPR